MTVNKGTVTNSYIPFYGYDCDGTSMHTQFVIPAGSLTSLVGAEISAMQFSQGNAETTKANKNTWHVKFLEVSSSSLSSFEDVSSATEVYVGKFPWQTTTPTLEFSSPYVYGGGDLLVDFQYSGSGNWANISFNGVTASGASLYNGGQKNFLPQITFTYELITSCKKTASVTVTDITSNSATISWDAVDGAESYDVTVGSTTHAAVTSTSLNVTGLSANTLYEVGVVTNCGAEDHSNPKTVSFRTECGAEVTPFSEGFEAYNAGELPSCWEKLGDGTVAVTADNAHDGSKSLLFYGNTSNVVVLPLMDKEANQLQISLWSRVLNNYGSTGTFSVGYVTDPSDKSTFAAVETFSYTDGTTMKQKTVMLNTVPNGARIAFRHNPTYASTSYAWLIDDIVISDLPSCIRPSALTATNIESNSAQISWTTGKDETQWEIRYKKSNVSDWTAVAGQVSNPCTLSDLEPTTTYNVAVRAYCGAEDQSEWSETYSFKTECGSISEFPWTENFNNLTSGIPECWDKSASTTSDMTSNNCWGVCGTSNKMMWMKNYNVHEGTALINTPTIAIPNGEYILSFDYRNLANCGALSIKISTDGGSSFSEVASIPAEATASTDVPATMLTKEISLSAYKNQSIKVQFFANANYGSGAIFVDNVMVKEAPSCAKPTALSAGSITVNSAEISWTAGNTETQWKIQYRKAGVVGWTAVAGQVTTNSYTLAELAAGTAYEVQVRAFCDAENQSEWSETCSFSTECGTLLLNTVYDFEDAIVGSMPACWSETHYSTSYVPSVSTNDAHESSKSLYFNCYGSSVYYETVAMPIADEATDIASLKVQFHAKANTTGYELKVGVMKNPTTYSTFVECGKVNVAMGWNEHTIPLESYTGEGKYIAFCISVASSYDYFKIYVDDITIIPVDCKAVKPAVSNVTDNSAVLASGLEDIAWAYKMSETGAETAVAANATATLTDLDADTEYTVYVQSVCSETEKGEWKTVTFRTACAPTVANGYTEDFNESTLYPSCMDKVGIINIDNTYGVSSKGARFNSDAIMILPPFESTTDWSTLMLSLDAKSYNAQNLNIIACDAAGENQEVLTTVAVGTSWGTVEVYLDEIADINTKLVGKRLALDPTTTSYFYVDNIAIKTASDFRAPSELALSDGTITADGASFTFAQTGTPTGEWAYEVATSNTFASLVKSETVDATSFSISGLSMATTYYVRVKQMKDAESSLYSNVVTFTTACGFFPISVVDNLDAYAAQTGSEPQGTATHVPGCWTAYCETSTTPYQYAFIYSNSSKAHSGNNTLYLKCRYYSSNYRAAWMALPEIAPKDIKNIEINFWASQKSGSSKLEVGLMSNPADKSTYIKIGDVTPTTTMEEFSIKVADYAGGIDLTDHTYVVFMNNATAGTFYIDDIMVDEVEPNTVLRELSNPYAGTICLERTAINLSGASFWDVTYYNVETGNIMVDEATELTAGHAYIFLPESEATEIRGTLVGAAVANPDASTDNNGLVGTFSPIAKGTGNALEGNYILYNNEFVLVNEGARASLAANRAYLILGAVPTEQVAPVPGRRRMAFGAQAPEVTTGVENGVWMNGGAAKRLINGQLFILRDGKMFTVEGMLVK